MNKLMYFKIKQKQIPVSSIKADDTFFKFSDEDLSYKERLKLSIAKLGIINPIVVQPLPERYYRLASGFKRFQIAKELNFSSVPANVLREDLSSCEILTLVLLSHPRQLSLTEKARVVGIMTNIGLSSSKICEEFGSFLEIRSAQVVEEYMQISKYPASVLSYIKTYGLSLKQALTFRNLSEKEKDLVAFLGTSLSLKGFDMDNILTDLKEIAIREGKSIGLIIEELGFFDVEKNTRLSRFQKINKIKSLIKKKRYPHLVQINKRLTELRKKLKFSSRTQISWDQDLEKGVKLSLDIKDMDDIKDVIKDLSSQTNLAFLSQFLKVYYEGLSDKENLDRS